METFLPKGIEKFLKKLRDPPTVKAFWNTVWELEAEANRREQKEGDGYYTKYESYHQRFTERLAMFYRYVNTDLHILYIGEHINDRNKYSLLNI